MCLAYTDMLESPSVYEEVRLRQSLTKFTYHSATFKDSLQQQIHFYGNIFGNKCYPDEGTLGALFLELWVLRWNRQDEAVTLIIYIVCYHKNLLIFSNLHSHTHHHHNPRSLLLQYTGK